MKKHTSSLSPEANTLINEQPTHWRLRLFLHVWIDENTKHKDLYEALLLKTCPDQVPAISFADVSDWLETRRAAMMELAAQTRNTLSDAVKMIFDDGDDPAHVDAICDYARRMSDTVGDVLNWHKTTRCTYVPAPFTPVAHELSRLYVDSTLFLFDYPHKMLIPAESDGISAKMLHMILKTHRSKPTRPGKLMREARRANRRVKRGNF